MNSGEIIRKLEKENSRLKEDYAFAMKKLEAKRYKMIDRVVDTAYKIVPKRKSAPAPPH